MCTRASCFIALITLVLLTSNARAADCENKRKDDVAQNTERPIQWKFDPVLPEGCEADCKSEIYCHGEILHDIEMARIYPDSKTFVDKKLLYPESEIVAKYRELKARTNNQPQIPDLKSFVDENFADDAFDPWVPPDFSRTPSIVNAVADEKFRNWLLRLNDIWKDLAIKMSDDVRVNPDRHSYLYVPNGFIKAGGRFTEMYYWDSYWVIKGLLLCDMFDTARGIIENMLWLVKKYGHMPNGNRNYYTQRSQPPLLIHMAAAYYSATKDHAFIKENLGYFDTEFQFWYKNRMTEVKKDGVTYKMARYNAVSCTPRPESYFEDYLLAAKVTDPEDRKKLFTAIKSAAESAWDFSSRHYRLPDRSKKGTLLNLDTQNLIFVDLNCFLQANAVFLSEWYELAGKEDRSRYYREVANDLLIAIDKVLWNEELGIWLDYDLVTGEPRKKFFPTNLTPLWTGSYSKDSKYAELALIYLHTEGITNACFGPVFHGVPASQCKTGEQWDFPNCWSPLQAFVIQGLERTGHPAARHVAFKMAQSWIMTTFTGFCLHGHMFEKYCALDIGRTGDGGEYHPQTGFGWTNGFVMELFQMWGKHLSLEFM